MTIYDFGIHYRCLYKKNKLLKTTKVAYNSFVELKYEIKHKLCRFSSEL